MLRYAAYLAYAVLAVIFWSMLIPYRQWIRRLTATDLAETDLAETDLAETKTA